MCGISVVVRNRACSVNIEEMVKAQYHRGPDSNGVYKSPDGVVSLGHNRLSVIDISCSGNQPMSDSTGRYWITFNGEIYNYLELRDEIGTRYAFKTKTDTEVLLAAYVVWGRGCLHKLLGMFAFAIWDEHDGRLFVARDRFGVKPLYIHQSNDAILLASEIKAIHAAGVSRRPNVSTWASFLTYGIYDHGDCTFWDDIYRVSAGSCIEWTLDKGISKSMWYDIEHVTSEVDLRSEDEVHDELSEILLDSVRLRMRADVVIGSCLSGGLDSSLALALMKGPGRYIPAMKTFTFTCGDEQYDEMKWASYMNKEIGTTSIDCRLHVDEVPDLAFAVQKIQDEPYGGIPTLGMAKIFEKARDEGVTVLMDGNGLDEAWAGFAYYEKAATTDGKMVSLQGSLTSPTRPDCLNKEFMSLARPLQYKESGDAMRSLQLRDITNAKLPRALRILDHVSMMYGREAREPYLDHRIVELGLRQPVDRKMRNGQGKWLVRKAAEKLVPTFVREATKRQIQTPQREWLRGPLSVWMNRCVDTALNGFGSTWFDKDALNGVLREYCSGEMDNSFMVWQWISLGLMSEIYQ